MTARYRARVGHFYKLKRGDRVTIISGHHEAVNGVVDSAVFQRTVDYPDEFAPGYHVVLDDGKVVTVRRDQVYCVRLLHLLGQMEFSETL